MLARDMCRTNPVVFDEDRARENNKDEEGGDARAFPL